MAAQTAQTFTWIIYVDKTLPNSVLAELNGLVAPYPNFRIVVANVEKKDPARLSVMKQLMLADRWEDPPESMRLLYMSTRLDADDGLSVHAVELLQRQVFSSALAS